MRLSQPEFLPHLNPHTSLQKPPTGLKYEQLRPPQYLTKARSHASKVSTEILGEAFLIRLSRLHLSDDNKNLITGSLISYS